MEARNLFAVLFLSMVFFLGTMVGCSSLSTENALEMLGIQLTSSYSKQEKSIAIPDQTDSENEKGIEIPGQAEERALNLEQAKTDLEQAMQKVKLAELKMEISVLEMKLADYDQKIAETEFRKVKIFEKCQKLEANHKDGRIKKASDIDKLKALKIKSMDLESENIQSKAAMVKIDQDIQELKQKVDMHIKHRASAD